MIRSNRSGRSGRDLRGGPTVVAMVAAAGLAACSGGGSGSSSVSDNPPGAYFAPVAEPPAPFTAADWSASQEYLNSTGLAQLRAAEGYARRTGGAPGGQGVKVAVIDGGIDLAHPDLGNLASQSWAAGNEPLTGDAHATFVAGIIAASRTQTADANDMHGMAYRATLVNFQAARPSVTRSAGGISFSTADLVAAIRAAAGLSAASAAVESDVLNLSLGAFSSSDSTFAALRAAMQAAAGEGKIMVIAAGNEGLDADPDRKLQPLYPAAYADDPGIAGHAIVVGNLTASDQAAASSNHCGDTRDYCLFAPGTNIRSTLAGGGYGVGSGTSFAAPYVAGAAAVVQAAFPGVAGADVVDRLLLTAADLGTAGVDSVFGRGRLDLEAAMAPVGPVGLPTGHRVDGPRIAAAGSELRLGPAFALGAADQALLAHAVGLDAMGFPFPVDLSRNVATGRRVSGLEAFVDQDRADIASAAMPDGRLEIAVAGRPPAFAGKEDGAGNEDDLRPRTGGVPDDRPSRLDLSAEPFPGLTVFASLNGAAGAGLGVGRALAERRMAFVQPGAFFAPFDDLGGVRSGGGLVVAPLDGVELALSAFTSTADQAAPASSVQKLELAATAPGGLELRAGLGLIQEESAMLGGRAGGAFGEAIDTRSRFATLAVLGSLAERLDWTIAYSLGRSRISGDGGRLLGDWSDARSAALGVGLALHDLAKDGDGLSLMVGQPLRGERARATLSVPVGRTPEGAVIMERRRIDLEPDARELATEATYRWPLGARSDQEIGAGGFLRFTPDHDPARATELGLALTYHRRF